MVEELEKFRNTLSQKKALIVGLDNVLYPKKDFVLQVFYMFGQFIEFIEAKPVSKAITEDLKALYLTTGKLPSFEQISEKYDLKDEYKDKLDRLYYQVQLPLRLDLFSQIEEILQELKSENKGIYVLMSGDPFMQLNNWIEMNWNGLDKHLKLYFADELKFKQLDPIEFILEDNQLQKTEVLWLEDKEVASQIGGLNQVDFFDSNKLIS